MDSLLCRYRPETSTGAKPMQANTQYGIEIEGLSNMGRMSLAGHLTEATGIKVECENYSHVSRDHWKLVYDGSIEADNYGEFGFELVSPILVGEAGLAQAHKLLTELQVVARVNASCGLHVHLNASDWEIEQFQDLAIAWIAHQDVLDSLQPVNRRESNNGYCAALPTVSADKIRACIDLGELEELLTDGDRYFKVNFAAFWRHQTVEIRHHSASVDPDVVCNWVRLMANLSQNAADLAGICGTKQERLEAICNPTGCQDVPSLPTALKGLKAAVMTKLGLNDSKAVKKWAAKHGLKVDLRSKAGWAAILLATGNQGPKLNNFYQARMAHYQAYNLVTI